MKKKLGKIKLKAFAGDNFNVAQIYVRKGRKHRGNRRKS